MNHNSPIEAMNDRADPKQGSRKTSSRQQPEQSRPVPGKDNDPKRGGYHHADTAMGTRHSEAISQLEQTITGQDPLHPADGGDSGDPAEKTPR